MKVRVNSDFQREIEREFEKEMERVHEGIIRQLCIIGEECVNAARITSMKGRDYEDQSGNLRGSVGYIVVYDGEIVQGGGFQPVNGSTEGCEKGKAFAESLAGRYKGYALVVVAGMNYAEYVAAKGYDVLDTAELVAERLCKNLKI